jgi:hypothetical protein
VGISIVAWSHNTETLLRALTECGLSASNTPPQSTSLTSNSDARFSNLGWGNAFVKMSATFLSEDTRMMVISRFSTFSRIKWYRMSICLVRGWNTGFFTRDMLPLLSQKSGVGKSSGEVNSPMRRRSQMASLAATSCWQCNTSSPSS